MKNRRRKKASHKGLILSATAACVVLLVIFIAILTSRTPEKLRPAAALQAAVYSDVEMHKFWDLHLDQVVMGELVGNIHPIPEIRERFKNLTEAVKEKYGRPLSIEANPFYHPVSRLVLAAAAVRPDGSPIVGIFVPGIMDIYRTKLALDPAGERKLQEMSVTILLHEIEHHLQKGGIDPQSKEELFVFETDAWAKTVQYSISPFVQHGYILDDSDLNYYNNWVACGKTNNACWRSYIERTYSNVAIGAFK